MEVSADKVVWITYTLTLDDERIAEHASEQQPFGYIHGTGFALPAFESHLEGLSAGAEFSFTLSPEESYGEYFEDNMETYPLEAFHEKNYPSDLLKVGEIVPLQDDEGYPMDGVITEITDQFVTIDFNHPLAGQTLHFKGKILSIRNATAEELIQGQPMGVAR